MRRGDAGEVDPLGGESAEHGGADAEVVAAGGGVALDEPAGLQGGEQPLHGAARCGDLRAEVDEPLGALDGEHAKDFDRPVDRLRPLGS